MAKNLGNELFKIYCRLWAEKRDTQFNFQEAMKILKIEHKKDNVNMRTLSSYFSKIKNAGWMETSLDPENAKLRLYQLKDPKTIIEATGKALQNEKFIKNKTKNQ